MSFTYQIPNESLKPLNLDLSIKSYAFALVSSPFIVASTFDAVSETLSPSIWFKIRSIQEFYGSYRLFKGHLITGLVYFISNLANPLLNETLCDLLDIYDDQNLTTRVVSDLVVDVALTPLILCRSRLVSSSNYSTRNLIQDSYSLRLITPTILISIVNKLSKFITEAIILDHLNIKIDSPSWHILSISGIAISCLITTPLILLKTRLELRRDVSFSQAVADIFTREGNFDGRKSRKKYAKDLKSESVVSGKSSFSSIYRGSRSMYRSFSANFFIEALKYGLKEFDRGDF